MPSSVYQRSRSAHQNSYHFGASSGGTKNSSSICSNSRVRKTKLPGVISLRKDLPTWAMPNGGFFRVDCSTLAKFTNMPCAVSGRRYATAPSSSTGPAWVLNIRLKARAGVNSQTLKSRGQSTLIELILTEPPVADRAVDERISEVLEVAARLPDGRRREDRGVDQHDVVALLHHRAHPGVLHVPQHRARRAGRSRRSSGIRRRSRPTGTRSLVACTG